jgi:CNT family concentrative nucleoside transporter
MTRSELFTLMTAGMATIAGTVMVLYASVLGDAIPGVMGHILTASIISVPAAVTVAKVMVPETASPTSGELATWRHADAGSMDAVTRGTLQGVELLINIVAMLVVSGGAGSSGQYAVGSVARPGRAAHHAPAGVGGGEWRLLVWFMGVPWQEAPAAGSLMGVKTILNEFLAYLELSRLVPGYIE